MIEPWPIAASGVIELPSGRRVRGRSLRGPVPSGPLPTLAVHLAGRPPPEPPWERWWIRWVDFWLPADAVEACATLRNAYDRSGSDRIEIACNGGVGRTGTGLAALAVLDGLDPDAAVNWVRQHYHRRAVEVPWQRRFLRTLASTTTSW